MTTFIMMVGLPGSGKSFQAQKLVNDISDYLWVSSDKIREELYGDESIQKDPDQVFKLMKKRTLKFLSEGKNVV